MGYGARHTGFGALGTGAPGFTLHRRLQGRLQRVALPPGPHERAGLPTLFVVRAFSPAHRLPCPSAADFRARRRFLRARSRASAASSPRSRNGTRHTMSVARRRRAPAPVPTDCSCTRSRRERSSASTSACAPCRSATSRRIGSSTMNGWAKRVLQVGSGRMGATVARWAGRSHRGGFRPVQAAGSPCVGRAPSAARAVGEEHCGTSRR